MRKHDISVRFINPPFVDGIEAVSGLNISNTFKRHIHKAYIIGRVTNGVRVITHSEGSAQISKGEIFIINPGQAHACNSVGKNGHSYQILSVNACKMQSLVNQIAEKTARKPYFGNIRYTDQKLSKNFENIFQLFANSSSGLEPENSIISFLSNLIFHFSESPPDICHLGEQRDSVKRVCEYIANNYSKKMSLNQLSRIACLSPFHFQRIFTKIMGISAHDYLTHYRISVAKTTLLKSRDIADIAIAAGFVDQSHFSKVFKQTVGVPPGKYIKFN